MFCESARARSRATALQRRIAKREERNERVIISIKSTICVSINRESRAILTRSFPVPCLIFLRSHLLSSVRRASPIISPQFPSADPCWSIDRFKLRRVSRRDNPRGRERFPKKGRRENESESESYERETSENAERSGTRRKNDLENGLSSRH